VTVSGALANFNLNGTYPSITVPLNSTTTFTFPTSGVPDGTYNNFGLAVANGASKSTSGWSDLFGADTIMTLGTWPADDAAGCIVNPLVTLQAGQVYCNSQTGNAQAQAGTAMHELGHTLGLLHGGVTYTNGVITNTGLNCMPNFQSVMNYNFQIHGLFDYNGVAHVDYSNQALAALDENNLSESAGIGAAATKYRTRWFAPLSAALGGNAGFLDLLLNSVSSRAATIHCNGGPKATGEVPMTRIDGPLAPVAIDWNANGSSTDSAVKQDLNFNGVLDATTFYAGANDWNVLDLRQIGARLNASGFSTDVAGIDLAGGGGIDLGGGGGIDLAGGGGIDLAGGGGIDLGGGGGIDLAGGGGIDLAGGGGEEVNFDLANSTVDSPLNVAVALSGHNVNVTWSPPGFGRIRTYYIWRAIGPISPANLPTNIGKVTGSPPNTSFLDTTVKNNVTYTYFVTAALGADSGINNGNQSGASNMPVITVKF
jgi:hypothetical protein